MTHSSIISLVPLLTDSLLWTARCTYYTISCPLVHRGRPWEGAIMWKINVYIFIYIIVILCICICVFFSLFSSFSLFFIAMCHSLIHCQSRRSVFSRWKPCVIFGLACVASYAQVSSLYIVEFLRYPLHLQNLLL